MRCLYIARWLSFSCLAIFLPTSLFQVHMKKKVAAEIFQIQGGQSMVFFSSAVTVLQTLVVALGAGLGIWGVINLLEGYGNDNPGAKSQGMKQFMAN